MTISERCVNKPTTTFLVFLMSVLLGIYCVFKLPVDMYPDMDLPYMIVITTYNGAGPEEVEQSVTRTLEGQLSGLSGLKKLQSRSMSGTSLIILEMNYGTNLDAAVNEIRDKIDIVRSYLPDDNQNGSGHDADYVSFPAGKPNSGRASNLCRGCGSTPS